MRSKQIDTKIPPAKSFKYGGTSNGIKAGINHQFATKCVCCTFSFPYDPAASPPAYVQDHV